jgi:general secretion pathway protein C
MYARIAAFVLWAAVAAGLMYWLLRVGVTAPALPANAQPVSTAAVLRGDVARLFADPAQPQTPGAPAPAEPGLASRFKLVGVMAPRPGDRPVGQGIALIEVDGKPPRPYRVGRAIDDKLVLQSVAARSATLGPRGGEPAVQLELPPPPVPATGTLPPPADGLESADGRPLEMPSRGAPPGQPPLPPPGQPPLSPPGQAPLPARAMPPPAPQQPFPQQLPPGTDVPGESARPPVDATSDEPPGEPAGESLPPAGPPRGIDPQNRR